MTLSDFQPVQTVWLYPLLATSGLPRGKIPEKTCMFVNNDIKNDENETTLVSLLTKLVHNKV